MSAVKYEDTPETVSLYKVSKQSSPGSVAFVPVFIHSAVTGWVHEVLVPEGCLLGDPL